MGRARTVALAQDESGNVQKLKNVTVYEADGTTPFAQTLYDAPTGGSVITTPQTDSEGVFRAYAPNAQRAKILVAGDGASVPVDFMPDPSNIVAKDDSTGRVTLPKRLTIQTEGLTIDAGGATVTAGGLSVAAGGAAITNSNAAAYALTVTQQNATNLIQKWVDSAGANPFIMTNTGLFSAHATAGIAIGNGLGRSRLKIYETNVGGVDGASGSYIVADIRLTADNDNADHAGVRSVMDCGLGDSGMRAGEFHATRPTGKTNTLGFCGVNAGVHSMTPSSSDTANTNLAFYAMADTATWAGNVGAPVPQDVAYLAHGLFDDFKDYFRAVGRVSAGEPERFRVAGGYRSGDQAGDVVSQGRWRGQDGSAAAPAITAESTKNVGVFFTSAGTSVAFSTAGTQRMNISATGNIIMGIGALTTNATTGFPYIPTCAGAPSGTPTALTGLAPFIYDSTNHKIWFYSGSWRGVAVT